MYGVKFNDTRYGNAPDFIMNYARVGIPEPKVKEIEVPGMNGVLDMSESLGEIKYSSRLIDFRFTSLNRKKTEQLLEDVHGMKKKIILDRDTAYFYTGRCKVTSISQNGNMEVIDIQAKCSPYKYKTKVTTHKEAVNGAVNIVLLNERMHTIPEITVDSKMDVLFEEKIYKLMPGTYSFASIVLHEKYNKFRVMGTGMITFRYQEGAL